MKIRTLKVSMKTCMLAAGLLFVSLPAVNTAASVTPWQVPEVGTMIPPQHVQFEAGEQAALPFQSAKGMKWYFTRLGTENGQYYTMTYAKPPDFSYGWVTVQELGIPFLFNAGLALHKDDSQEAKTDLIASWMNDQIMHMDSVTYTGTAPLQKTASGKNACWEGQFTQKYQENGIVYNETYLLLLKSMDMDAQTLFLLLDCDGEHPELAGQLKKMIHGRKPWKEKKIFSLPEEE